MFSDDQNQTADALLAHLDAKGGASWLTVAQVLTALESQSRRSPDGRPWLDIVRERLAKASHAKTPGHLRKMRRAYAHLQTELPHLDLAADGVAWKDVVLTALETAERIARLDPEAGREALRACLSGASAAKLQQMYDAARAAHADQLTARQLAWDTRRKTEHVRSDRQPFLTKIAASLRDDPGAWWDMPGASVTPFSPGTLFPYLKSRDETWFTVMTPSGDHCLGGLRYDRMARGDGPGWQRLLETVLFRSSFLDRLWLLLDADPAEVDRFRAWLETLAASNIGLARVVPVGDEVQRLWLGRDAPTPDRRGLIRNALLRRGT